MTPACMRCFLVDHPCGLHARPAALFARTAQQYGAAIFVGKNGEHMVNGKSVLALLMLAAECGDELVVTADGEDAREAIAAIQGLFADMLRPRDLTVDTTAAVAVAEATAACPDMTTLTFACSAEDRVLWP
ncbi:MAG: HPr family phosphocarrier protein [Kiritimatiellae bacterium]|nr:HPr family phosphocarrier protein [Kiritimatiellia bacterium]